MRLQLASGVRLAVAWLLCGFGVCACSTQGAGAGNSATAGSSSSAAGTAGNAAHGGVSSGGVGGGGTSAGGTESNAGTGGGAVSAGCDAPGLTWKTANKTWYTSYPDPGSEECIKYSGCMYAGQFSACDDTKPEAWVSAHNIVAAFPDFASLQLHDLCLKSSDKTIVVTVLDTCGDADCGGCCTQNQGDADELIDVESYTNDRWGVEDGQIQWADLGATKSDGCN
jgi:hypothetical protein